ncbi:hypothetical protein JHK87_004486 [Glycine soja]|nr:hypothetical protein JHK87_004486 [Glycine soja]
MVSPPDTQDIFHTPPKVSLLPSSDDSLDRCVVSHAINVDAESQVFVNFCDGSEFVDLGKDSDLGFSEVQLTQEMNVEEDMGSFKGKLVSEENELSIDKSKNYFKKVACTVEEGKKSSDGAVEASRMRKSGKDPGKLRVLSPFICGCWQNAIATRMEHSGNSREKMNAFYVLRFLSLNSDDV